MSLRTLVVAERSVARSVDGVHRLGEDVARALEGSGTVRYVSVAPHFPLLGKTRTSSDDETPRTLGAAVAAVDPQIVLHVPAPDRLLRVLARARGLRGIAPRARHILLHGWPFPAVGMWGGVYRLLAPDRIWVGSYRSLLRLRRIGLKGEVMPLGGWFESSAVRSPHSSRDHLVLVYSPFDDPIDLAAVKALREIPSARVAAVAGPKSTAASWLQAFGVVVLDGADGDPYDQADAVVFSARGNADLLEIPQTVLAALARGIPVLATRHGGMPDFLPASAGVRYWATPGELMEAARKMLSEKPLAPALHAFARDGVSENMSRRLKELHDG